MNSREHFVGLSESDIPRLCLPLSVPPTNRRELDTDLLRSHCGYVFFFNRPLRSQAHRSLSITPWRSRRPTASFQGLHHCIAKQFSRVKSIQRAYAEQPGSGRLGQEYKPKSQKLTKNIFSIFFRVHIQSSSFIIIIIFFFFFFLLVFFLFFLFLPFFLLTTTTTKLQHK